MRKKKILYKRNPNLQTSPAEDSKNMYLIIHKSDLIHFLYIFVLINYFLFQLNLITING